MKFKIDENLPADYTAILERAGFQADTVSDEKLSGTDDAILIAHCRTEGRTFMTLDLDFANIQAYPPPSHVGIVVFRPNSQDKPTLIMLLERVMPTLLKRSPEHQLWIVETDRIRIRE